jgi:hypothetical protein
MNLRRLFLALAAAAAVAAVAAVPALAKEDVFATLLSNVPGKADPGTKLPVSWTLFTLGKGGRHVPFDAGGIFVRLRSESGSSRTEALASPVRPGLYRATVAVPKDWRGHVQIGLRGWTSGPNGTHRSDLIFTITNPPPAINLGPVTFPGRAGTDWAAVVTAGILGSIVVGLLVLRIRRPRQSLKRSGSRPLR